MAKVTLLSAARAFARSFRIDMEKGGIITVQTLQDADELERQISGEMKRQKDAGTYEHAMTADDLAQQARWTKK